MARFTYSRLQPCHMWKIACVQVLYVCMICIMDMPWRCVCVCVRMWKCTLLGVRWCTLLGVRWNEYVTGNNAGTRWCLWIYVMRACKHPYRCICESCTSNLYPSLGTTLICMWKQKVQRPTLTPQFLAKDISATEHTEHTTSQGLACASALAAGRSGCTVLDF